MNLWIRHAEDADVPEVVELGRAMAAEAPRWQGVEYDADRMGDLCRRLIALEEGVLIVARQEDSNGFTVVGFIAGLMTADWFTAIRYASNLALYVVPERRNSHLGQTLIGALEGWAKNHGAAEVYLGTHTGANESGFVHLAERLGYRHAGATLRKVL